MKPWDFSDPEFVAVWTRIPVAVSDAEFRCDICGATFSSGEECGRHTYAAHPIPTAFVAQSNTTH